MNVIEIVLPSLVVAVAVAIAAVPFGAPAVVGEMLQIMPYMVAHLFLVRGKGLVPSPVMFAAGLVMDVITDGPLGFWAIIYLTGVLILRHLPHHLLQSRLGRLWALLLLIVSLTVAQFGLASVYQLRWVDWQGVGMGTVLAGLVIFLVDLVWRDRRNIHDINGMGRGSRGISGSAGHA